MVKRLLLILALCAVALSLSAREPRRVFGDAFDAIADKESVFRPGGEWLPYPAYADREGWAKCFTGIKSIVKNGQVFLGFDWEANINNNKPREALAEMILSELAEGKGQFLEEIFKGLRAICRKGYLSNRAEDANLAPEDKIIALMEAAYGAEIAFAWHFFKDVMDPALASDIQELLRVNIFDPYLNPANEHNHQMNWLAINFDPAGGGYLNNWCPYCSQHVIMAFLLAEQDQGRLIAAIEKSTKTLDAYINYAAFDGSCEEGPSYWNMAGAKVYEYARMMCDASGGRMNLLSDGQIIRMGEWRPNVDAGDGLVLNFSDGGVKGLSYTEMFYRIGVDCGSQMLVDYAILSSIRPDFKGFKGIPYRGGGEGNRIYRALEGLKYRDRLKEDQKEALLNACGDYRLLYNTYFARLKSVWYPDNEQAMLRVGKKFLAAKGGHNNEAHNHNDVGSFILFDSSMPVIIDPGINHETYPALHQGNKYVIWSARSEWHNLPIINGFQQAPGKKYKTRFAEADPEKGYFRADISTAYPMPASCKSWIRTYAVNAKTVTVTDEYDLKERLAPDVFNYVVWKEPALPGETLGGKKAKKGEVLIQCRSYSGEETMVVKMKIPAGLSATKEEMKITDKSQRSNWGNSIWRITLTGAANAPLKGSYKVEITR